MIVMFFGVAVFPLSGLSDMERANFLYSYNMYNNKAEELIKERDQYADFNPNDANDPAYLKYRELSSKIAFLQKKADEYKNAVEKAPNAVFSIIAKQVEWNLEDLKAFASSMWEKWDTIVLDVFTGNYTEIIGTAVEKMMMLRIRKNISGRLGSSSAIMEYFIYYNFVEPKVDWQSLAVVPKSMEEKVLSLGKELYFQTITDKACAYVKSKLTQLGKSIAASVGNAINITQFASDIFNKLYLFYSSDKTVEAMLNQISLYMKREKLPVDDAFFRYLNSTDKVPKTKDYMNVKTGSGGVKPGQKVFLRYYAHSQVIYREGDSFMDPYVAIFRADLPHGNKNFERNEKTRDWLYSVGTFWLWGVRGYIPVNGKQNPGMLLYEIPKDLPPGTYQLRMHYGCAEDPAAFMWSNDFTVIAK